VTIVTFDLVPYLTHNKYTLMVQSVSLGFIYCDSPFTHKVVKTNI